MSNERSADGPPESADAWRALSDRLSAALHTTAPPVAISFIGPGGARRAARLDDPYPEPTPQGRTGQVPAGCVFWIRGATKTFTTTAADHANCSVGSLTHGLISPEDAASKDDIAAVLDAGWVDEASVGALPRISSAPEGVAYGPLRDCDTTPDVVLLRLTAIGLMTLSDALPGLRIEGKPQCHIVAIAKEHNAVAASVGCALSRARTGMRPDEMTCTIPGARVGEVVSRLESTVALNRHMAHYAAADAARFSDR